MIFIFVLISILVLVLLIVWAKINPFISFLISSILAGFLLGIPVEHIAGSVQKGMGDLLGGLVVIIIIGAMLGKLVADSGAAQRISEFLMALSGKKYINWAMMVTGFVVGIPLFFNVGFVLLVPLVFSVAYQYRISAIYIGIPMLAALSVTHGLLPPHPSPAALVAQFGANMGLTLLYGIIVAIPTVILAGPIFSSTLKRINSSPLSTFQARSKPQEELPGIINSLFSSLLPVFLLIGTSLAIFWVDENSSLYPYLLFVSDPSIVMLISLLVATYSLGLRMKTSMATLMDSYVVSVKDIAMILLIIAGAGALKQVLMDSGVSDIIALSLNEWNMNPLFLGWLIAAIIRICVGSATVAGLTAAGIIAPLVASGGADPNLMVISIGAGSLIFSHFNDGGFWLVKEYFNLSIKDTLQSWSLMETIAAIVGLITVLTLDLII
ncbi:MAG TPA: gluconate:H+ symporter [Cyclobacteriaceae bacterium]|nr:gluconate:H+ symporter [Cyclobacteriaceae bacterium]